MAKTTPSTPASTHRDTPGITCFLAPLGVMPRPHRHDEMEISFHRSGSITALIGGRRQTLPVRRIFMFWAAVPHQALGVVEPGDGHMLMVPLVWLLRWEIPGTLTSRALHGELIVDPRPDAAFDARLFERWEDDFQHGGAKRKAFATAEIAARLGRLGLDLRETPGDGTAAEVAAARPAHSDAYELDKTQIMASFITEHFAEPLDVQAIARAAGLHPNYAVTLFRKTWGMGLVEFVTRHRIAAAQRLLAITDLPMLDVAMQSGFGSASQFYAAFKRVCGQSPKRYRDGLTG